MSPAISFSHVHIYADRLDDLQSYKKLEDQLNDLSKQFQHHQGLSLEEKHRIWLSIVEENEYDSSVTTGDFLSQNRDVVKQLLAGMGFRITGARYSRMEDGNIKTNTRSVLITSQDPNGIQVIVTANESSQSVTVKDPIHHFDASRVRTFFNAHNQRQGFAVLAFLVDDVQLIRQRYELKHPNLISHYQDYEETIQEGHEVVVVKLLEVYAFYKEREKGPNREADQGTILRFMEMPAGRAIKSPPGLIPQPAVFEEGSVPAYSDHWVSNVISRTEFLDVLHETLDFNPKVDFNAGVVAAGEAQIESTVTGNDSTFSTNDKTVALQDQSQVYLPINNALSEVGHVHLFLKEIGQGIQHVASRVSDLPSFVQRVNYQRRITGEGCTFLKIPRSYYGVLTPSNLEEAVPTRECAQAIWSALDENHLVAHDGSVDLDISSADVDAILTDNLAEPVFTEYASKKEEVIRVILRSRYKNLYSLLRNHLNEDTYLRIVRNQILVDIQGEDLLYQIFTCKILHREARDEAPFFEFIQRVCSDCCDENGCPQKIRPGCGGFGIRNFLTLFLSIEVSKAMQEVVNARAVGDVAKQEYEQRRVDYFTAQLNESNPILTEISDAMTDEGHYQQQLASATDPKEIEVLQTKLFEAEARKRAGNCKLMKSSAKYNELMKSLRKSQR